MLAACLFAGLFVLAGFYAGVENVWAQVKELDASLILGLLGLSLLNYVLRGWRWHFFAQQLKVVVPLARLALYYTTGFALVTTPGKVGTAIRLWFLKKNHNVPYSRSTPLMVMDQLTDFMALFMMAALGVVAFGGHLFGWACVGGVLAAVILFAWQPGLMIWVLNRLNIWTAQKFNGLITLVTEALTHLKTLFVPSLLMGTTFLSVIGWGAEGVAFYWLLETLGHPVTWQSAFFVFAFATLVGGLSMLPGGLGGTEVTMVALLLALDIPTDVAVVATGVIRLTTLWFAVALGFMALPIGFKSTTSRKS